MGRGTGYVGGTPAVRGRRHISSVPFKVVDLVLPLSLDSFAVAAGRGIAGLSPRERLRLSLICAAFEALMPLVGLAGGRLLAHAVSGAADYIAIAVLLGVGLVMLRPDGDELPENVAARSRGLAALGLGLSVSLDELAIGFTIGLLGLAVALAVALIAAPVFLASRAGAVSVPGSARGCSVARMLSPA